jgi:hypothetical protein
MGSLQLNVRAMDENATEVHSGFHVADTADNPADYDALADAYQAVSNAEIMALDLTLSSIYAGTLSTGAELDAEDKAVLTFEDEDMRICSVTIAAPKAAVFLPDGKTVNSANALVADFIAAVLSAVVTAAGVGLTKFIKGWRSRRNRK